VEVRNTNARVDERVPYQNFVKLPVHDGQIWGNQEGQGTKARAQSRGQTPEWKLRATEHLPPAYTYVLRGVQHVCQNERLKDGGFPKFLFPVATSYCLGESRINRCGEGYQFV